MDEALRVVRMSDHAESAPHMLSGGQKQRIAIAGVLAMQPKVMIFDESTAMLDPMGREEVLSTVRRHQPRARHYRDMDNPLYGGSGAGRPRNRYG